MSLTVRRLRRQHEEHVERLRREQQSRLAESTPSLLAQLEADISSARNRASEILRQEGDLFSRRLASLRDEWKREEDQMREERRRQMDVWRRSVEEMRDEAAVVIGSSRDSSRPPSRREDERLMGREREVAALELEYRRTAEILAAKEDELRLKNAPSLCLIFEGVKRSCSTRARRRRHRCPFRQQRRM